MERSSDYRLVAIDLDGTLLTDKKIVTDYNREVLKELNERGIEIVIATGRRYYSAKLFAKRLGIPDITILANNGTIVRNIRDDEVKVSNYIDEKDFYKLVEEGRRIDITPITHVNKYDFGYDMIGELDKMHAKYNNYIQKIEKRYRKVDDLLYVPEPNVLAAVFPGEKDFLRSFQHRIEDISEGQYTMYLMDQLVGVSPILEIIKSDCSKWHSVEDYAKLKGITPEEIICIGDDMNDLEMIESCGLGIAMKNATPGIKERADMITEHDNNDSGVGYALKEIFSSESASSVDN